MPNRIIKESVVISETVDALTVEEERFFYRLITYVDDFGRGDKRDKVILSKVFPLKIGEITTTHINNWMKKLEEVGLIISYTVGEMDYFYFPTWEKHQTVRNQKSKYPNPPELDNNRSKTKTNNHQLENNCIQLHSIDNNNIQKKTLENNCKQMFPKTETETETETRSESESRSETETETRGCQEKVSAPGNVTGFSTLGSVVGSFPNRLSSVSGLVGSAPEEPDAQRRAFNKLQELGVNRVTASELILKHTPDEILQQIEWLPQRKAANPPAILVQSIRENWKAPNGFVKPEKSAKERAVECAAKNPECDYGEGSKCQWCPNKLHKEKLLTGS